MSREIREALYDLGYEDLVLMGDEDSGYDEAIVGVTTDNRAVYDYDGMVKVLMDRDGMTYEEAVEFIDYNPARAVPYYPNGPIIMHRFPPED